MKTTLEKFNWTTVFLLCDMNDRLVPFYAVMCVNLKGSLTNGKTRAEVYDVHFNTVDAKDAQLHSMLEIIATRSRGMMESIR